MTAVQVARSLRRIVPRRERPTQRVALGLGIVALVLGTALSILNDNTEVKIAGVVVTVLVLSSLILSMVGMLVELLVVVCCLATVFTVHGFSEKQLSISGYVLIAVTSVVGVVQARRRDALGLREVSAETVLSLISERLLVQAQLPSVPDGWGVEIEQRPADGAAICGDFVANRLVCAQDSRILHLAVVDVSGSGITAGPRALLLSGAVGGLLGSVPPEDFLPAANDYLARQQWSLGFASAIYLRLDLDTGEYSLRVAGHPPALQFRPSLTPPWRSSAATGTVLGVLPDLAGAPEYGLLQPGESMFLYTDGVIEDRTRDLDVGTMRFRQAVESLAEQDRWEGAAEQLIERVPTELSDDRTVVMIRRQPVPAAQQPIHAVAPNLAVRQPTAAPTPGRDDGRVTGESPISGAAAPAR